MEAFLSSPFYGYLLLPFIICISRVADVSLGTLRIVAITKGFRILAAALGFFEVLIWITVITHIMDKLNGNYLYLVAWAIGFAIGNYIGICIEERLALGTVIVRVIMADAWQDLIEKLKHHDYRFTIIDGYGRRGQVKIIFAILKRSSLNTFVNYIHEINPSAVYTVEDVKLARGGIEVNKNFIDIFNVVFPFGKQK